MTTVNNTIDKFGRRWGGSKAIGLRGPAGVGFKLTSDNHYDIQGKCLKNMGEPTNGKDGATRSYVDGNISGCVQATKNAVEESANVITDNLKKYIAVMKTEVNMECIELSNKMRQYVNDQISEFQDSNIKYIENKKIELHAEYEAILNKRINDVTDILRVYVNEQIKEFKGLNIVAMRQNNVIVERMAKIEHMVKDFIEG